MKENSIENLQNKKYFNNIDEAIKVYEEFRRFKNDGFIESIDIDFFFNLTDIILSDYKRVLKENEEVKRLIAHKNEYTKKLEEDLFENAENYVISKQKVKDKIRHYQELQDNYIKKYDEINEGLQAMINDLQELIEEREEK